jgi:drug/metabolite transporter (DMT)-like permease
MTPRGWALFVSMALIWGIPYLLIKVALDEGMPPAIVAWARVVIAAVVLLPLAWWSGALRGLRAHWRPVVAFAVVEIVVPFPLIAAGEQFVSSSLTAILIATVPLMVALLAVRFDASERVSGLRLVGLLVGLGGVAVLLGIDVAGRPEELVGAAMILVASVGYAIAPMIVKQRLSDVPPLGPVTAAVTISAVLLAPLALLSLPAAAAPSPTALGSVAVLGIVCSAIAFLLFFGLIKEVGPGRATVITYVNPLVAVALGVLLLGEHVSAATVAGLALILSGSWIATRRGPAAEAAPATA